MAMKITPKEIVISELLDLHKKYEYLSESLINANCSFSRRAIRTHFGNIGNFMKEFNIKNNINPPQKPRKSHKKTWTKEEVISKLKEIEESFGYVSKSLLEKIKSPTPKVIYRIWKDFYSMYEETGIKQKIANEPIYSKESLIEELNRLYSLYNGITREIINQYSTISYMPFYREFKTIENMYLAIKANYKREYYLSKSANAIISIIKRELDDIPILEFRDKRIKNPKTNRALRIDAYFPKYNLAIEIHGLQHYTKKSHFFKTDKEFKYRKALDRLKRMQLKKYGFNYIELKYSLSINSIKEIISKFVTK